MTVLHDAELVVINAIEALNLCDAYREVPTDIPSTPFATVTLDGSGVVKPTVSEQSLTVYFYADTWKAARTLGLTADKLLIQQLLTDPLCYGASIASTYRSDDPDTNQPRCALTLDVTLCG